MQPVGACCDAHTLLGIINQHLEQFPCSNTRGLCAEHQPLIRLNRRLFSPCAVPCCAVLCQQAQALLQQLERRKLYKYVSEVTLDVNAQQRYTPGCKPTAEEIVGYQSTAHSGVGGGQAPPAAVATRLPGPCCLCSCSLLQQDHSRLGSRTTLCESTNRPLHMLCDPHRPFTSTTPPSSLD